MRETCKTQNAAGCPEPILTCPTMDPRTVTTARLDLAAGRA